MNVDLTARICRKPVEPGKGGPRPYKGEHGDPGGQAASGISSVFMSRSGYQRLKMPDNSPFSVRTRVCNNRCAPSLDHCICCFLQNRLLTTSFTVDSTNPVAIASPLRYRSPSSVSYTHLTLPTSDLV